MKRGLALCFPAKTEWHISVFVNDTWGRGLQFSGEDPPSGVWWSRGGGGS